VKHAVSVNSATSGLYCAVGAVGVGPGDEVIVSPYTMAASATAALVYNAVPVFADIEPDCFCLSAESVAQKITERTKAILVVDIFGQPYDVDGINALAKKHGLIVIEDAAQAPGATFRGRFAGTLGDIGVYSLNYHKHIHSGEGGVVVTDDLQMRAVTSRYGLKDALGLAVNAGADILLIGNNLEYSEDAAPRALNLLMELVAEGVVSPERIRESAGRVLALKAKRLAARPQAAARPL